MMTTPPWSAVISQHVGSPTVALSGEVDLVAAEPPRVLLIEQLDRRGTTGVTVDLAAVTFLDSAALGALIDAYHHARGADRLFMLVHPARPVRRVLEISGV